jgi:hypothetical protein
LILSEEERAELQRVARRAKSAQALALRARIVPACADGLTNKDAAARVLQLGVVRTRHQQLVVLIGGHLRRGPGRLPARQLAAGLLIRADPPAQRLGSSRRVPRRSPRPGSA